LLFHGYYQLNQSPPIVSTWDDAALWYLAAMPKKEPVYCLVHLPWHHAVWNRMLRKKLLFAWLRLKGIKPLLITNSPEEDLYRRRCGIDGFRCISYVYTDEKKYSTGNGTGKKYDAVYAAQLRAFKRIGLAAEIESLYVLTYTPGRKENDLPAFCPAVKHASYNRQWLDQEEKLRIYHQSRVGLCLSAEEGPMLASLEYQLAGLPVISTRSRGGRDTYYHPESSLIVEATPGAIKASVKKMIERAPDPPEIRKQALKHLVHDRQYYTEQIAAYVQKDCGARINPAQLHQQLFPDPSASFVALPGHSG
jgi:glycosyltransferase involved in cell wall biosynthesis